MRLSLVHTTTYRYAREVGFNPHRLMLRPRGGPDLRVLGHTLQLSPAAELVWTQDVFGNLVATAHVKGSARDLTITSALELEATAPAWPIFQVEPRAHTYPFSHTEDEAADLGALLGAETIDPAVAAWARGFVRGVPTDTLSLLKDVNAGVLTAAAYRVREEEGTQTSGETLRIAEGACRDLAALFVDAVRSLGFGARAVSGYLFDPETPSCEADTTHAWAEVFLPGAGWIPFDPTHARTGGAGLITIAVGRCNAQILPVAGSYVGAQQDFTGMTVGVRLEVASGSFGETRTAPTVEAGAAKAVNRYDCRRDAAGWTVFDRWTGRVVVLHGAARTGMAWPEANELAMRLNERRPDGDRNILQ